MSRLQILHCSIELWGAFFSLVAAILAFLTRRYDRIAAKKLVAVLLVSVFFLTSDAIEWLFRGDSSAFSNMIVRVSHVSSLFFGFIAITVATTYYAYIIKRGSGVEQMLYKLCNYSLATLGILFLIVLVILDSIYYIEKSETLYNITYNIIPDLIGIMSLVNSWIVFFKYYKHLNKLEIIAIVTMSVILLTGLVLQIFNYDFSFDNLSFNLSIFIMFFSYEQQFTMYMVEQEKKYNENRIRLFNSQIKPHFVFNSLSAIRALCRNSPEGVEAINDFSIFLRGSLDLLNNDECISAEKEFKTVSHYMNIITKRFDEGITVKYNLENTDFLLPPFCVQTLCENAVRHGIRKRENRRGVITINSYRKADNNIVEVIDDGVGFDTSHESEDSQTHTGLNNTRQRLELMCSGRLEIESEVGKGTTARIIIPA